MVPKRFQIRIAMGVLEMPIDVLLWYRGSHGIEVCLHLLHVVNMT